MEVEKNILPFPSLFPHASPQFATLLTSPQVLLSHLPAARSYAGPREMGVSPQSRVGSSHDLGQSNVCFVHCVLGRLARSGLSLVFLG